MILSSDQGVTEMNKISETEEIKKIYIAKHVLGIQKTLWKMFVTEEELLRDCVNPQKPILKEYSFKSS